MISCRWRHGAQEQEQGRRRQCRSGRVSPPQRVFEAEHDGAMPASEATPLAQAPEASGGGGGGDQHAVNEQHADNLIDQAMNGGHQDHEDEIGAVRSCFRIGPFGADSAAKQWPQLSASTTSTVRTSQITGLVDLETARMVAEQWPSDPCEPRS